MVTTFVNSDFQTDFWERFEGEKTLHNVLRSFVQRYPYRDIEYRKKLAREIIGQGLIRKSLSERKLLNLLESELSKIDLHSSTIKHNTPQTEDSQEMSIFDIDKLSGNDFQNFLAKLLEINGFTNVQITGTTGDQGGDLLATQNDKQLVIQAKRLSVDRKVNNGAVQEVLGAIAVYNANKGVVVTNSFYTQSARELAKLNDVELWDRRALIGFIEKYNSYQKSNTSSKLSK